jgi:ferredoxin
MDKATAVVICNTVAFFNGVYPIPGTIEDVCKGCGVAIAVSPSSQRIIAEDGPGVETVCLACGMAMRGCPAQAEPISLDPRQIDELSAVIRDNEGIDHHGKS